MSVNVMNNYLLSVDPSMKNTGFTLWEKIKDYKCYKNNIYEAYWQPIWIDSYCFNKKKLYFSDFVGKIFYKCQDNSNLDLVIERGIFNPKFGKSKETLDHLRGFIAGQFNKILTKDMLISSKEWRKWYTDLEYPKVKKWSKEYVLFLANEIKNNQEWDIEIKDHDQADNLLIGWYWINKEVN